MNEESKKADETVESTPTPKPSPLSCTPKRANKTSTTSVKSMGKPWRLNRDKIKEEQTNTAIVLQASCVSKSSTPAIHYKAVIFCYEADNLLDQLEQPLKPLEEVARQAVDSFRMLATNGDEEAEVNYAKLNQHSNMNKSEVKMKDDIRVEEARKLAAQSLKDVGLEEAMREALKKTPAGRWPVMHEIVKG